MNLKKTTSAESKKPTLRTISQISGLAVATVSRALKDAPDLRKDTKLMVRRIADEIGYVPNRAGLGLRTGKTNVVSLALSSENDIIMHTSRLISSIAGGLRGTPYHLTITPFFPDQDPIVPIRDIVETGSADAVIFHQTQINDPRVKYLLERKFPFATHGRTHEGLKHPYFDYDNNAFARIAVRKLARKGCRSIVLIAPEHRQAYSQDMCEGALNEAKALGIDLLVEDLVNADMSSQHIRQAVVERLKMNPDIDGYIGANALTAMSTVAAVESLGRTLGQDIQLATKDAMDFLSLFRKEIIILSEDIARAGTFLSDAVLQAIDSPDLPPKQGLEVPEDDGQ
ncbi:LacI family transcriptional regulator [Pseudovibrio sp. Tun.PSC04-5.I4]|uniref:LacI family transcriptional regulator n=1 Tax=Pseudovibrio sp. Tun.PSC04-5.I4 TaxID=1798213 RepID=UPI000886C1B2|nr:LacI family transcriptional regulator [Pseudovibrio sp. Tun.PSC04-5.I4]SDQ22376.1 transcriptional regulator, LacI family [Pseudovibrio sp. Tun.PSC04-5.I4]